MLKNTVTGSVLAKLFPTMSKYFLENASQEEVNKAEQEAAVIHQQMQGGTVEASTGAPAAGTPAVIGTPPPTTAVAAAMPLEIPAPAPAATEIATHLSAMTTRATTAEGQVTDLTARLAAAEADRDRYKAWHDKQTNLGNAKPGADASTRGVQEQESTLSAASQDALNLFRKSRQTT